MYRDCRYGWLLCLLCSMLTVYNVHSFTVRNVEEVQSTTVQQESHDSIVENGSLERGTTPPPVQHSTVDSGAPERGTTPPPVQHSTVDSGAPGRGTTPPPGQHSTVDSGAPERGTTPPPVQHSTVDSGAPGRGTTPPPGQHSTVDSGAPERGTTPPPVQQMGTDDSYTRGTRENGIESGHDKAEELRNLSGAQSTTMSGEARQTTTSGHATRQNATNDPNMAGRSITVAPPSAEGNITNDSRDTTEPSRRLSVRERYRQELLEQQSTGGAKKAYIEEIPQRKHHARPVQHGLDITGGDGRKQARRVVNSGVNLFQARETEHREQKCNITSVYLCFSGLADHLGVPVEHVRHLDVYLSPFNDEHVYWNHTDVCRSVSTMDLTVVQPCLQSRLEHCPQRSPVRHLVADVKQDIITTFQHEYCTPGCYNASNSVKVINNIYQQLVHTTEEIRFNRLTLSDPCRTYQQLFNELMCHAGECRGAQTHVLHMMVEMNRLYHSKQVAIPCKLNMDYTKLAPVQPYTAPDNVHSSITTSNSSDFSDDTTHSSTVTSATVYNEQINDLDQLEDIYDLHAGHHLPGDQGIDDVPIITNKGRKCSSDMCAMLTLIATMVAVYL